MKKSNFNTIEEMSKEKADWVVQTKKLNNFNGIKNTLTKLYTSSGHFIFELLQNAEDVYATEVKFELYTDRLVFEHNGSRPFDIDDINSITNIGDSTKEDDGNSIGKYGVGFKSVFEYTASPEIHSANYHFKIIDLFIPKSIDAYKDYDPSKTVIILPFNTEKNATTCYEEIKNSFNELESDVLLFLQNIAEITCVFEETKIKISRTNSYILDNCPKNVCRIQKSTFSGNNRKNTKPEFYKRFFKKIKVRNGTDEKKITIGIAFQVINSEKKNWKIFPIVKKDSSPGGEIFAYFPCKSEECKFCFHIHAPFALTVDREKLRENDEANIRVIECIGQLICESMEELKDVGLVSLELYKTLPNLKDDIDLGKYEKIRSKVITYFLNNPYILMSDGSYEDPHNKFIGSHNIQNLLSDEDLSLFYNVNQRKFWVKNPMQNNRDYNFLISLGIKEFGIVEFLKILIKKQRDEKEVFNTIIERFQNRNISWFVRLYSLMFDAWKSIETQFSRDSIRLLQLCYCNDEKLYPFEDCYLINSVSSMASESIHCVNIDCLISQETRHDLEYFFEDLVGIKEYELSDLIHNECRKFEEKSNKTIQESLMFYEFYKEDNSIIDILKQYKIFCSDNGVWDKAEFFYLSEELKDSCKNLSIYYDYYNLKVNEENKKIYNKSYSYPNMYKLNPEYKTFFYSDVDFSKFLDFLDIIGIYTSIVVWESPCKMNPMWLKIQENSEKFFGGNATETDVDYEIKYLDSFLKRSSKAVVFELIWNFLKSANLEWKNCEYSPAKKYLPKSYNSHIVLDLCNNEWVLQVTDDKTYFVKPEDACLSRLPEYYEKEYENSSIKEWLLLMNFGKNESQKNDSSLMEVDIDFVHLIKDLQNKGISKQRIVESMNILKNEDSNFIDEISDEMRNQSVRISKKQKELIESFLRSIYSDEDNRIHCQICKKTMPFKNKDGEDYFESVQLFSTELVQKEVKENYVALCPVCSAKMKVYYQYNKNSKKQLYDRIYHSQPNTNVFRINLDRDEEILFSECHISELKQSMNNKI
ncbi:hypothetical protein HNP77_001092 [Treponema rectale]|uniref:Sacsin/Nov domain-containing protein n=1 Tax=Treponema rectale TaxID=744512 RepID=A0A840SGR5_9SPIR|nr:hypothetical protein [Treponema rectale]MBB5218723.1 hypothetical protein [Treponema rectale]